MKKPSKRLLDQALQDLALRMAFHCVRNTIIEDYHAKGKLSDSEMKAFNKEVVNKIYSFLQITHNPAYQQKRDYMTRLLYKPDHWDTPVFDKQFLKILRVVRRSHET